MIDLNAPEIRFALDAVRKASRLAARVQQEMVPEAAAKDDRSPVTVADYAVQALIGHLLMQAYPEVPLVGEEDSSVLRAADDGEMLQKVTSYVSSVVSDTDSDKVCQWIDHGSAESGERFWTVDPVDGTKGFLRGDQYAVALALIEEGEVKVAVLGCPNLVHGFRVDHGGAGSMIFSARGQGTWTMAIEGTTRIITPLIVSEREDPAEARILRSFEKGHTNVSQIDKFAQALGVEVDPVRMDSQAKYGILASGHGDLLLRLISPKMPDYREKIWDQAAGSLVVEEAGGKITDLDGKALDFTQGRTLAKNRGVLASNGKLHEAALQTLQKIGA